MYETDEELDAFFDALCDIRRERVLGKGGFGIAVLAMDETEQVKKVFKFPLNQQATEALRLEGKNLLQLQNLRSRHIIQLYKYGRVRMQWQGRSEDRYYLCLEFGGSSLRDKLGSIHGELDANGNQAWQGSGTSLPTDEALRISIEVCLGLEAAHGFKKSKVRIIHRDIKPENIFIDDETGVARIADFGISRVIDRSTGICSVAGTLLYMDPECFQGHAGPYSDLYSLGIVMYEMFTGHLPFRDFQSRMIDPPTDPRQWNPELPDDVARIILCAITNDLEHRYATASEMLADLKAARVALNPLPPEFEPKEKLRANTWLCEDRESQQPVIVHYARSEASLSDMQREKATIERAGLPSVACPIRAFRNEPIVGLVYAAPSLPPASEALGGMPVASVPALIRFCELMAQVCDVVAAANAAGLVHGHLSPDQIYYADSRQPTLYGYGAAPLLHLRRPGEAGAAAILEGFADSLAYISPQILRGQAPCSRDDVFSLGAVMYTLLTGRPYAEPDVLKRVPGEDMSAPSVPPLAEANRLVTTRLADVVTRALDWEAPARPDSAAEVADRLRQCRWPDDLIETLIDEALRMYEAKRLVEAYNALDKALDIDPGNARVHYTRARIYYREKDYKWAVEELCHSAQVMPTFDIHLLEGRCFADWDKPQEAAQAFTAALQYGDSAELRYLLAKSLWRLGQAREARRHMRCSIALESDKAIRNERRNELHGWADGQEATSHEA